MASTFLYTFIVKRVVRGLQGGARFHLGVPTCLSVYTKMMDVVEMRGTWLEMSVCKKSVASLELGGPERTISYVIPGLQ